MAVHNTAVEPYRSTSSAIARTHGLRYGTGNVCASSKTITESAMLCSLRHREVAFEYRLSKNCTAVVTTIGAFQFSAASARLRSVSSMSDSFLSWYGASE